MILPPSELADLCPRSLFTCVPLLFCRHLTGVHLLGRHRRFSRCQQLAFALYICNPRFHQETTIWVLGRDLASKEAQAHRLCTHPGWLALRMLMQLEEAPSGSCTAAGYFSWGRRKINFLKSFFSFQL